MKTYILSCLAFQVSFWWQEFRHFPMILDAGSVEGAKKAGMERLEGEYPSEEGWFHSVNVEDMGTILIDSDQDWYGIDG